MFKKQGKQTATENKAGKEPGKKTKLVIEKESSEKKPNEENFVEENLFEK